MKADLAPPLTPNRQTTPERPVADAERRDTGAPETMVIVKELSASGLLSAGGWDPRYAVTLAVASYDDVAGALIDTNGDEADIDLDVYERDADGTWQDIGSSSAGEEGTSWSTRVVATWGRGAPGEIVNVDYLGQSYSIVASPTGWWLFVMPSTEDFDAVPQQRRPAS